MPERITVEAEQVCRLVQEQFPQWAGLPIEPVANGGWDNRTFHLGTDMVVRLPSAAEYAQAVEKEHRWLPVLAPQLPLPIPVPLAKGKPGADYPHSWSIYPWIDGVTATAIRNAVGANHRTLSTYLTALVDHGLTLESVREPAPPSEWVAAQPKPESVDLRGCLSGVGTEKVPLDLRQWVC